MNTQNGFSSILALLLVASVIGGGYYFYSTNEKSSRIQEIVTDAVKGTDVATTTNDESKKVDQFETMSKEDAFFSGFYFTKNNNSIIDPVTKAIVEKRQEVTDGDIGIAGKILKKDDKGVLIEIFTGGCLGSDSGKGWPSVYVYAPVGSDRVYAFKLATDGVTDVGQRLAKIDTYMTRADSEPEKQNIQIQLPPSGNAISDGYHYAQMLGYNEDKNTLTLDFLSLRPGLNNDVFDVLMSETSNLRGLTANVLLENNNKVSRTMPYDANKEVVQYLAECTSVGCPPSQEIRTTMEAILKDQVFNDVDQGYFPEMFLKIQNEKIIDISRVYHPC